MSDFVLRALARLPSSVWYLFLALGLYAIYRWTRTDSLKELKSPPGARLLGGHLHFILHPGQSPLAHELCVKRYGRNVRVQGLHPWDQRLLPLDPVTLLHILKNTTIYEKPKMSRDIITRLIGLGMLSAEGHVHKRQRRVATPAFSVQNLRALIPLVFGIGEETKDRWMSLMATAGDEKKKGMVLDVSNWMGRATFDVIGLAGFDYHFNAVQNETNELFVAYRDMFETSLAQGQTSRSFLGIVFPFINKIFPDAYTRAIHHGRSIITKVATELVQQKKRNVADGIESGKDLLTLLLRSNAAVDLPEEQRISDDDILHNINTFIFAGSDTTSLALTWTLLLLAKHLPMQTRLREELRSVPRPAALNEEDTQDLYAAVAALPYLDNVVRESLRLISPVHSSLRVATVDDYIPTGKPFVGADGRVHEGITIRKGTYIHVPIEGINLDRKIWGENAWQFVPDRWNNLPEAVLELPGLYSNILTFSAGPRSCIGQKFSLIEIKAFLYTLIGNFVFTESDQKIVKANVVLTRPYVSNKFREGSKCPLMVTPFVPSDD
ncbi:cytochrome-450 hydroxylase [Amylostereum chailletii]|nr:cytochrome-450 hydroxylase [Amylostereum chailletii]